MSKELVIYKDELNTVPLRKFNSKEMDLFFSICSKMRNRDLNTITFDFEDLRELSNYKMTATDHFISDLEGIYSKLIQLDFRFETEKKIIKFVLFTQYEIDKEEQTISISVNERFKYILNNISGDFTKFELIEFTSLNSSYSKTAYRFLKQFRSTGYYIVKMDEFKRLFDIPESYQMNDITKNILNRIEDELPQYFKNLKVTKLRGKGKRKRFIDYIEFKFEPQNDIKNGIKTFRDKETGEYYEKNIMDFTNEEVDKTFKDLKPLSENVSKRKQMGLPTIGFSNKEVDEIYDSAMNKILESRSNIDVFGYVNYYWETMKDRKGIGDPTSYLKSLLKNDYDRRLGQQVLK